MICKWMLLYSFCVLLTSTKGNFPRNILWAERDIRLYVQGNIEDFKAKLHQQLKQMNVDHSLIKKKQSSKEEMYLSNCVELLEGRLSIRQRRIDEIASQMKRVWISSNTIRISSLNVNGKVFSRRRCNIRQLNSKMNASSPVSLINLTKKTTNKIELLQSDLDKTLFKSNIQEFKSKLILKNVMVKKCKIDELNNYVLVNYLPISRLTAVLRKKGNQKFQKKVLATTLSARKSTVGFLNGNRMEDFIQLNPGTLSLNRSYVFENVSARTIFTYGKINGVKVIDFVLVSKEQNIYGLKTFERLSANTIRAELVDGIHLNDLKQVKEDSAIYPSELNFSSNLVIQGNLNISSLNGYDIKQLFLNSVTTTGKQPIYGKKSFKHVVVDRSVTLAQKINYCNLDQFMTVKTNQSIHATVEFPKTCVIFQNILTNSLNGIDLSQQAVIRNRNNVIRGVKTFTNDLIVSKIKMKEGIHIDSFDPSTEVNQFFKKNDIETRNSNWFDGVIGNINATDVEIDAKYFPPLKNLENVWLRSTEQYIPLIKTESLRVNNLNVSKVNNINVKDLVTVKGNTTIHGPVHFIEKIFTKHLNLSEKSNVNFSPEYWSRQKVKISNNITIDTAVLKRNLAIDGSFRNFESGFMHKKDHQAISGYVQFEEVKVKDLNFNDFKVSIINGINMTDFLQHAVVISIGGKSIHNKHFKSLRGSSMICKGTLNNISLEKVVLKNSVQSIIASWTFTKPQSFKNIRIKNLLDGVRLENVIYKDEYAVISNKIFNGNIATSHISVSGYLNGVNISSLQQEAFNKSKRNSVKKKIIFHGNITANEIQVTDNEIDSINLKDAIRLDATTQFTSLHASSLVMRNITVAGLINTCDINSVMANAFTLQEFKSISSRSFASSLVIEGNLEINYLLGEKFSDWITSLEIGSSPEIERNVEFERLNSDIINVSQPLNEILLNHLVKDSVKKTEYQIVLGRKNFRDIYAQKSSVQKLDSYKTCGININEMFEFYVNKSESRMFAFLNPSIGSLAAKQVSVRGMLNYLRLPTDVVLSNVSETIWPEVIINNTVEAPMGLKIYGRINGIELRNFILERVTLNSTQEIFATFNFTEDTILQGNTGINGSINNLRLENALKKFSNKTITGNKYFTNILEISTDVSVNGPINGIYLDQLLWSSRNESVKEVQLYRLNASDLICHTINGVNINELYSYTHITVHGVNEKLDNMTNDILELQDSMRTQSDALENPQSTFSYFELHEIIKYGPILKFLPVYEYGTTGEKYELQVIQMVMWVNKQVKGCKKIMSLIADATENATFIINKNIRGKVFPFSLQVEKEDVVGFYVQTAYSPRRSSSEIKHLIVTAISSSDLMNSSTILMPKGSNLVEVRLLDLQEIYLIVALHMKDPGERIFIYHYDAFNNSWSLYQQFHLQNPTSMEFISVERDDVSFFDPVEIYLSVTGHGQNSGITVYEWDHEAEEFFLKTNLSTTASTHTLWLYAHRTLYLLLAKEKTEVKRNHTKIAVFNEPLEIYTLDEDELVLNHIVNIRGIRFMDWFSLGGEIFVLATSSHMEVVYVLQFRGYNGFEIIQEIAAAGITEARVFTVDSNLYVALNSITSYSRILKASIRGGRLFVT